MELQEWRLAGASVLGTSHEKLSAPCQDCHRIDHLKCGEEVVVLLASDGAGSASKSEFGSNRVCDEILECVRLFLLEGGRLADVTREIALGWLESAGKALELMAQEEGVSVREYACTLLVALISETHAVFCQVGDGAIVFWPRGDDGWCLMSWPQHGEYINTTVFMSDPVARASFEFCARGDIVDEVAVFTDGIESLVLHYASQSLHGPFFDGIFPPLRKLPNAGIDDALSKQLGDYLASPKICEKTDDDKTLVLASRVKRPASRALVMME
jgi:hypothetical protein